VRLPARAREAAADGAARRCGTCGRGAVRLRFQRAVSQRCRGSSRGVEAGRRWSARRVEAEKVVCCVLVPGGLRVLLRD